MHVTIWNLSWLQLHYLIIFCCKSSLISVRNQITWHTYKIKTFFHIWIAGQMHCHIPLCISLRMLWFLQQLFPVKAMSWRLALFNGHGFVVMVSDKLICNKSFLIVLLINLDAWREHDGPKCGLWIHSSSCNPILSLSSASITMQSVIYIYLHKKFLKQGKFYASETYTPYIQWMLVQ